MTPALSDHVRGDLVTPAIDWLGQLIAERGRPLSDLDGLLARRECDLLFDPPESDAWVPSASARNLVDAILHVHGGRSPDVLRELGRRTTPHVATLSTGSMDRLALRLSRLIQVGRWHPAAPMLPGDLVELHASRPLAPTLLAWIGGLLNGVLQEGSGPLPSAQIQVRRESPVHAIFVRCALF